MFTNEQRNELEKVFLAAQTPSSAKIRYSEEDQSSAELFVSIIESWGSSIAEYQSTTPGTQKERKRAMDSVANSVTRLDEALADLDSAALGYLYAHIVDALALIGIRLSPTTNGMTSVVNHSLRAMVEAGELRSDLRNIIGTVVSATASASASLPKHEHVENDTRLQQAKHLERQMNEHRIPFTALETGTAATFLRAIFTLGGIEVEKMAYWLQKVVDDPDNDTTFRKRMRGDT